MKTYYLLNTKKNIVEGVDGFKLYIVKRLHLEKVIDLMKLMISIAFDNIRSTESIKRANELLEKLLMPLQIYLGVIGLGGNL